MEFVGRVTLHLAENKRTPDYPRANLDNEASSDNAVSLHEWTGLAADPKLDAVLKSLRSTEIQHESAPPNLNAELRPYQRTGYGRLKFVARIGLSGCLADDMGWRKTVQVLSLLLDLKRDGKNTASLLVVPTSLIANWKAEIRKFAPSLRFAVAHPSEVGAKHPNSYCQMLIGST